MNFSSLTFKWIEKQKATSIRGGHLSRKPNYLKLKSQTLDEPELINKSSLQYHDQFVH